MIYMMLGLILAVCMDFLKTLFTFKWLNRPFDTLIILIAIFLGCLWLDYKSTLRKKEFKRIELDEQRLLSK